MIDSAEIAKAYLMACRDELDALKPGNVHRHADGHGMTVADFERSAEVSAKAIARSEASVGARIFEAVTATRAAVGQNTNLGIILLAAPLAAAAERWDLDLRASLAWVLQRLDVEDARAAFAAIAAANPGGLGTAERHDVRIAPTVTLRQAMAEAAERDLIARQYVEDYVDVFGLGLPTFADARRRGTDDPEAATAVYLGFLANAPDSHVARKFGPDVAEALRREAVARVQNPGDLEAWDADLKARGLNPGTSADLTVATLFAYRLLRMRDERLASPWQQ